MVPQGRETEFLFASPNGLKNIAQQADCCRLFAIRCNRPYPLPPTAQLHDELGPLLFSLQPDSPHHASTMLSDFPILALHNDVQWSTLVSGRLSSPSSSTTNEDYTVEELELGEGVVRRRLVFLQNQSLIQTEVQLRPPPKTNNKKKKAKKPTSLPLGKSNALIFDVSFIDDHHRGFLISLLLAPRMIKRAHNGVNCSLIGFGGGAMVCHHNNCNLRELTAYRSCFFRDTYPC